jgi:hypothetical protein
MKMLNKTPKRSPKTRWRDQAQRGMQKKSRERLDIGTRDRRANKNVLLYDNTHYWKLQGTLCNIS